MSIFGRKPTIGRLCAAGFNRVFHLVLHKESHLRQCDFLKQMAVVSGARICRALYSWFESDYFTHLVLVTRPKVLEINLDPAGPLK